jgi:hypothetical protein
MVEARSRIEKKGDLEIVSDGALQGSTFTPPDGSESDRRIRRRQQQDRG